MFNKIKSWFFWIIRIVILLINIWLIKASKQIEYFFDHELLVMNQLKKSLLLEGESLYNSEILYLMFLENHVGILFAGCLLFINVLWEAGVALSNGYLTIGKRVI